MKIHTKVSNTDCYAVKFAVGFMSSCEYCSLARKSYCWDIMDKEVTQKWIKSIAMPLNLQLTLWPVAKLFIRWPENIIIRTLWTRKLHKSDQHWKLNKTHTENITPTLKNLLRLHIAVYLWSQYTSLFTQE